MLCQQTLRHNGSRCIAQETSIRYEAHKAKMHWRNGANHPIRRQLSQPVYREDTVRIAISIGCVVVKMINSKIACRCVARYFPKAGVTVWTEQVMMWLAFQVYARR